MSALAYDLLMAPLGWLGLARARARLTVGLEGRVLEVGTGTGLLLAAPGARAPAIAVDVDLPALDRARRRGRATAFVRADVQALPFARASFDAVVASLTFCSVPDPAAGFAELHRVLRPGGTLRLLEHVRAPGAVLGPVLDALTPAWKRVTHGCHLNRDPLPLLEAAGFAIVARRTSLRGTLEEIEAEATARLG